jgi:hypothetical protein
LPKRHDSIVIPASYRILAARALRASLPGAAALAVGWLLARQAYAENGAATRVQAVARLLVFVLPLLPLLYLPWILRRWKECLLAVVTALLAAGAAELAGPWLRPLLLPRLYSLPVDHRQDDCPECPWKNGIRVSERERPLQDGEIRLLFLGDSFTAGEMLGRRLDAFPFLLERALRAEFPRVRVVNMAWVSSSPLLQLRQMTELGAGFRPDVVVQCFDMTDFYDDLLYGAKLDRLGLRDPESLSVRRVVLTRLSLLLGPADLREWWLDSLKPRWANPIRKRLIPPEPGEPFRRFQPLRAPRADWGERAAPVWEHLRATAALSRSLGADYLLALLPRHQQFAEGECPRDWEEGQIPRNSPYLLEPFSWFQERASAEHVDFPVISMLSALRDWPERPRVYDEDPHYNEAGHRAAAAGLLPDLRRVVAARAGAMADERDGGGGERRGQPEGEPSTLPGH